MSTVVATVRRYPTVAVTTVVLAIVLGLYASGSISASRLIASGYVLGFTAYTCVGMVRAMLHRNFGLDILAVIAMLATVAVDEFIAAVLIVLMLVGGRALERFAAGRAQRELNALLDRTQRSAHRMSDERVQEIPVAEVRTGDLLLVKSAEVVPVDGILLDERAETDESSLTGESLPVSHQHEDQLLSGSINLGPAIRLRATAIAADSQYQQIVDLVRHAQSSKAPVVRLADRFAVPFTLVSLIIAGLAWALSGDAARFAEVLVLATPCPLLIAAPVAFIAGMSRSAQQGIIVKSGASIEELAHAQTVAFDKTGTLTTGRPSLVEIRPTGDLTADELLRQVASSEQYSTHALAASVIDAARNRGLEPVPGNGAQESATDGITVSVVPAIRCESARPGSSVTASATSPTRP